MSRNKRRKRRRTAEQRRVRKTKNSGGIADQTRESARPSEQVGDETELVDQGRRPAATG